MESPPSSDLATLRRALAEAETRAALAAAAQAIAKASDLAACNALLALQNEKMRRELYGQRSERGQRLIDQLALTFEDAEATASEDERLAAIAAARTSVTAFVRAKPSRKPFPAHLPRERVVIPAPTCCPGCGSDKLARLGEDITETLEVSPRRWKVIQTVREKVACRRCETIHQPPAPFHVTPRGWAGPGLLAMLLFEKFGQHQPLNRQRDRYAREGVDLSLSTLADQVGACAAALRPLHMLLEAHVLAAERLHGDDTTVPVLAKIKTDIGRIWTYVRDDRPFGGPAPPGAIFHYSRDRRGPAPGPAPRRLRRAAPGQRLRGLQCALRSRAIAGTGDARAVLGARTAALLRARRCRDAGQAPPGLGDPARAAGGRGRRAHRPDLRHRARHQWPTRARAPRGAPRARRPARRRSRAVDARASQASMSRHAPVAKAIDYMLKDWPAFTRFLEDGRVCLTNNAAERALRGIALGRKSWLFAGSDRGGQRAAFMYSLIVTAKLNDIDPQAWLADVLARIPDLPQGRLAELLPWNWQAPETLTLRAAA